MQEEGEYIRRSETLSGAGSWSVEDSTGTQTLCQMPRHNDWLRSPGTGRTWPEGHTLSNLEKKEGYSRQASKCPPALRTWTYERGKERVENVKVSKGIFYMPCCTTGAAIVARRQSCVEA